MILPTRGLEKGRFGGVDLNGLPGEPEVTESSLRMDQQRGV